MNAKKKDLPDIVTATTEYEKWIARHVNLLRSDMELKHRYMRQSAFPFLRATFYRWAQLWPVICPELARATRVLAVGDLHVDNFGTWRDLEGRLIWGINDFDEAWPAAYTVDLVRLLTSAYVAIEEEHLKISRKQACAAVEQGYRDSMAKGGGPFVLAEHHRWLRLLALNKLRDPVLFWKKIESTPAYKGRLPEEVRKLLHATLPIRQVNSELKTRVAGLGSLGHPRVLALVAWHRAHLVREAKQLTPSAWAWVDHLDGAKILSQKIIDDAVRIPDPQVHFIGHWIIRRLAPDCCHIEIQTLPSERDEEKLLYSMGWETANIHLGSERAVPALKRDPRLRKNKWLHKAAKGMLKATLNDWKEWRRKSAHIALPKHAKRPARRK
jgi:hypothetical protein